MTGRPWIVRAILGGVRLVSWLVPMRDRDAWRREWDAEILHRAASLEARRRSTFPEHLRLARRASGSIADAAWLRRQFTRESEVIQDIRHSIRLVRSRPAAFLFAAAILAVGIGSTTAVLSLLDRLVVHALPYDNPGELVGFWQRDAAGGDALLEIAPGDFDDWRSQATSFTGIAASEPFSVDYTGASRPEVLMATRVTDGFFDVLRVRPLHGRLFDATDYVAPDTRHVVISHGFWQRLGADPSLPGRGILLDAESYTIVGVLPKGADLNLFDGRDIRDVYLPKVLSDSERQIRGSGWWAAIGRLKPGVTRETAQREMDVITARLATQHARTNARAATVIEPLETNLMRTVRPALTMMLGAAVLVLLIACANVANLQLVRSAERTSEFGVREALGASRARIVRQILTESWLIAMAGTALGMLLAWATVRTAVQLAPVDSPRLAELSVDASMLSLAFVVGTVTSFLFGAVPALQFGRRAPLDPGVFQRTTASRRSRRLRDSLVVSEIAVAVVLAVGVGLLGRSFIELVRVDPGFQADRLAVAQVFAWDRHATPEKLIAFFDESFTKLRELPELTAVGAVSAMPFIEANINIETPLAIVGRPPALKGEELKTFLTVATPGYFAVMRIPVLEGRGLDASDRAGMPPVAVVSRSLARRHWPNGGAVGAKVEVRFRGRPRPLTVVGVVGELRHDGLSLPARDELFLPFGQAPFGSMTFVMESSGDPARLIEPAKRAIWSIDPGQTFYDSGTVSGLLAASVAPRRFALVVTGAYALTALGLAALGIYAVLSVATRQRTREIGVRLALGASPRTVTWLVLRHGAVLAAAGLIVGLLGATLVARLIRNQLFATEPLDPITIVGVATLVAAVTIAACLVPARRATRVDPVSALRE
jgi:putative ABC transport system permease protein